MDITKVDLEEGEGKKFKYKLCIRTKQESPWATIYDNNCNILYMFRPLETDMQTIQEANYFMRTKNLPLFDIKKYHIEDRNNYYYTSCKILKILNS